MMLDVLLYGWVVLVLVTLSVHADVIVKTQNETLTYFIDEMATFGPSVPDEGITGFVWNVQPSNACSEVAPPPDNTSVWIALIARNNCTFVEKVRNAQASRYKLAIVYNSEDDPHRDAVMRMSGDDATWPVGGVIVAFASDGKDIKISSVFIGWSDGVVLSKNYCYNCTDLGSDKGYYQVTVDSKELSYNPYLLWPFAIVVGTCFVLMLVFMVVKWCRDCRRKRKSRLSSKHLKKIPTKKFKKGDDYDVCAICLDDYEEGDKLRLLPCSHVYHTKCIDPWLTKNKRSCPICKRKVIPGSDPDDSDSDSSDDEGPAPSERTPLLGGSSNSGSNGRRSTFDNSGLPETVREPQVTNVNEVDTVDTDSGQSDSEIGAVGGVPHLKLAKENQMVSLRGSSVEAEEATSSEERVTNVLVNTSAEDAVVIEANQGTENSGFVVDGEDDETDEDADDGAYHYPDDDVVFSETGKKDEKKFSRVI